MNKNCVGIVIAFILFISNNSSATLIRPLGPIMCDGCGEGVIPSPEDEFQVLKRDKVEIQRLEDELKQKQKLAAKKKEAEKKEAEKKAAAEKAAEEAKKVAETAEKGRSPTSSYNVTEGDKAQVIADAIVKILDGIKGTDINRYTDQEKFLSDVQKELKNLADGESKEYSVEYVDGRYVGIHPSDEPNIKKANTVPTENSLPWNRITLTGNIISRMENKKVISKEWLTELYNNNPDFQKTYTLEQFIKHAETLK